MTTEVEYKRLYEDLANQARDDGWKITFVGEDKLLDYAGMNYHAGKDMGYEHKIHEREIHLSKGMSWRKKYQTLWHELFEVDRMRKGDDYWTAHRKSLAEEAKL